MQKKVFALQVEKEMNITMIDDVNHWLKAIFMTGLINKFAIFQ